MTEEIKSSPISSHARMQAKAMAKNYNRDGQMEWYYGVYTDGKSAYIDSRGSESELVFLKEVEQIWVTLDGDRGYKCVYDRQKQEKKNG